VRTLTVVLIIHFFLLGCQAKSVLLKPSHEKGADEGEVFLYAQPFPQEAERLSFSIQGISAVRDDGTEFPLSLRLSEFESREIRSQRQVASGMLPQGRYAGFSFTVRKASLKTEEGDANLLVPAEPVMTPFIFDVRKEKAYVFSLSFNYAQSIKGGLSFSPAFSVFFPERPVVSLIGYVANHDSNNITVFDKKTMQVTGFITTGRKPSGMAFDRERKRAYVTLSGDDSVDVIDITTGEVINSIPLSPGDRPQEPAITPDKTVLLTANTGSDTVSLIDPAGFIELSRIPVDTGPHSIVVDPAGKRAYVFNTLSGTITVIDLASSSVAATMSTDPAPIRGQFNKEGDRLYVIHEWSSYVTVIDPFSLSVLNRIRIGMGASALKLDTRTNHLYVGKRDDTLLEEYDPFSYMPIDYIKGEEGVSYLTIDNEENNLYLAIPGKKIVMIVDIISKKALSRMDVGEGPYWVTIMGER